MPICAGSSHDGHHFVPLELCAHYPAAARRECRDAPVGLFVRGNPRCLRCRSSPSSARATPRPPAAKRRASFAAHLARCGLTITSGLALGIDAASHRGALDCGGTTVAVCGTGLDSIYPPAQRGARRRSQRRRAGQRISARHAAAQGQFPAAQPASSADCRSARWSSRPQCSSGSLITARLAAEQGREVFAIPGSIHNPLARGCHQLIRQGAKLVETADDIFDGAARARRLAGPAEVAIRSIADAARLKGLESAKLPAADWTKSMKSC